MFYLRFSGDWQGDRQATRTTLNYAACLMLYLRFSGDWQSPSKPRIFAKHQCHVGSFQVQQISDCKGSIEHQKAYNPRVYVRAQLYLAYPSLKTLNSSRRSFTRCLRTIVAHAVFTSPLYTHGDFVIRSSKNLLIMISWVLLILLLLLLLLLAL